MPPGIGTGWTREKSADARVQRGGGKRQRGCRWYGWRERRCRADVGRIARRPDQLAARSASPLSCGTRARCDRWCSRSVRQRKRKPEPHQRSGRTQRLTNGADVEFVRTLARSLRTILEFARLGPLLIKTNSERTKSRGSCCRNCPRTPRPPISLLEEVKSTLTTLVSVSRSFPYPPKAFVTMQCQGADVAGMVREHRESSARSLCARRVEPASH